MQVHLDTPHPGPGDIRARTNPGNNGPFAIVKIGPVEVYLHGDADCDALIGVATDAKRMWQAAESGERHPFGGGAGSYGSNCEHCGLLRGGLIHEVPCPSVHLGEQCTVTTPGHDYHYGRDTGGGVRLMWTDADVLAASVASGQPVTVTEDEDEALPDCAAPGCGHPEDHHYRDPAKPVASGGCDRCRCVAYALPLDKASDAARGLQDPAPVVRVLAAPETAAVR